LSQKRAFFSKRIPTLTNNNIEEIANGKLSFDKLIRDYIHENLTFRFVETEKDKIAYELENAIKNGTLNAGKPFLDPTLKEIGFQ